MKGQKIRKDGLIIFLSFFMTLAVFFALPSHPSYAAISFVQNVGTAQSKTSGTTLQKTTVTVTGTNSIIVAFAMDPASGTVSCADSASNTYTKDVDISNGSSTSGVRTVIFSAHNVTALSSGSITVTHPTATARAMAIMEASGIAASYALDKTNSGTGTGTSPSSGTASIGYANELQIGAIGVEGPSGDTFTKGANWTTVQRLGTTGSLAAGNITINQEYVIVSSHVSYTADGTMGTSRLWAAAIATYRESCSADFSYRRKITLQSSQVVGGSDFTNFPALVSESGNW